jgi:hypothetical protein
MTNRYFFNGTALNEIFDTNLGSSNSHINNHFGNSPFKVLSVVNLTSSPTNFSSHNNSVFSASTHKNSYFTYDSDEEIDEAPPYFINNASIFENMSSGSTYQKIITKHIDITQTNSVGTITIPTWCNAIKVLFSSSKGTTGGYGATLSSTHDDRNVEHENTNFDRHYASADNDRDSAHHNRNTRTNQHWATQVGGIGGAGGNRIIGSFTKYLKFTPSANNQIEHYLRTGSGASSTITFNINNGISVGQIKFYNGTNGATGKNATLALTTQTIHSHHDDRHRWHDDMRHHHNNTTTTHSETFNVGYDLKGNDGTDGSPATGVSNTQYFTYNDQNTSSVMCRIFFFKYRTTLRNSNPFTWTSYSNYGGSGYTKNNLSTRTVTTNTGYAPQDLYWARSGTLGNLEYNTNVSPATSTVQQLPSGFPSGHAFYLTYSVNVTLKKFDIYVSNHELNEPFFPEKLRIYGASLSSGSDGVEIYSGKPVVISDIPDNKSVDYGGSNECNNTTAYKYYFFVIEEIVGPIAASNIYYGLKINYIHPFIQENI